MWPWEHVLFAYLSYSVFSRVVFREPPGERETLALAFASILPDLIDKPLAWEFGVFSSGYALGHSLLFAVPLSIAAGVVARTVGRGRAGLAFGVGYLFHLVGDVIPIYAGTGEWSIDHLLWPVVTRPAHRPNGLVDGIRGNLSPYVQQLLAFDVSTYFLAQLAVAIGGIGLWIIDGTPGPRGLYAGARRTYLVVKRFTQPG